MVPGRARERTFDMVAASARERSVSVASVCCSFRFFSSNVRRLDMNELHSLNSFRHSLNTRNYKSALLEFANLRASSSLVGVLAQKDLASYLHLLSHLLAAPGSSASPAQISENRPGCLRSLAILAQDYTDYILANPYSTAVEQNACFLLGVLEKAHNTEDAKALFEALATRKMEDRGAHLPATAYETMFSHFFRSSLLPPAVELYTQMLNQDIEFSSHAVKLIIECHGSVGDVRGAFEVINLLLRKGKVKLILPHFHALLHASTRASIQRKRKGLPPLEHKHSIEGILERLQELGFHQSRITRAIVVSSYTKMRDFEKAKLLVEQFRQFEAEKKDAGGNDDGMSLWNSMLNVIAQEGDTATAKDFYLRLHELCDSPYNAVTHNIMLSAHVRAGDRLGATEFFERLLQAGEATAMHLANLIRLYPEPLPVYEKYCKAKNNWTGPTVAPDESVFSGMIQKYIYSRQFDLIDTIYAEMRNTYHISPQAHTLESILRACEATVVAHFDPAARAAEEADPNAAASSSSIPASCGIYDVKSLAELSQRYYLEYLRTNEVPNAVTSNCMFSISVRADWAKTASSSSSALDLLLNARNYYAMYFTEFDIGPDQWTLEILFATLGWLKRRAGDDAETAHSRALLSRIYVDCRDWEVKLDDKMHARVFEVLIQRDAAKEGGEDRLESPPAQPIEDRMESPPAQPIAQQQQQQQY
ncbi:MAG: hypothetical protein SGCHY_001430 [Lobulomycetales sp.]